MRGDGCSRRLDPCRPASFPPSDLLSTATPSQAEDNDPPDSYLRWPIAWPVLVWGMQAHKRWHYRRDGQPAQFVRWFIRFRFEPNPATAQNLVIRAWCALTCREMPWEVEAREEEEEAAEKLEHAKHQHLELSSPHSAAADESEPCSPRSDEDSVRSPRSVEGDSARTPRPFTDEVLEEKESSDGSDDESELAEREEEAEDIFFKRAMAGTGIAAVYLSWVRSRSPVLRCGYSHPTPGDVHLVHLCGAFAAAPLMDAMTSHSRLLRYSPTVWHDRVSAAGPGGGECLRPILRHLLRARPGEAVAGHRARGRQGCFRDAHHGAAVHQLARGLDGGCAVSFG